MENLNQYIKEALVNHKIKSKYKYHPLEKNELFDCIAKELKEGNTNLNCIDTSEIKDMVGLFSQTVGIKLKPEQQEKLDVSQWDVSNVENMDWIFSRCKKFNCNLSDWDVYNVKTYEGIFFDCDMLKKENRPIWNHSK